MLTREPTRKLVVACQLNFFFTITSALKQAGNNQEEYSDWMHILGKYYSHDIHDWTGDDGKTQRCPWHHQHVCSCGKCDREDSVSSADSVKERQVDHEEDMEDSGDSSSEGSKGSEDS